MNYPKSLDQFPNFIPQTREGGRAGYYCPTCDRPLEVSDRTLVGKYDDSYFATFRMWHDCGTEVAEIYDDNYRPPVWPPADHYQYATDGKAWLEKEAVLNVGSGI